MRRRVVLAVELLRKQLGNGRRQVTAAQRDGADGFHNFRRLALLVQVAARALADQVDRIVFFGVAAQDQDAHVRRLGAQHGQGIQPALAGHRQVHQQYIDFLVAHQVDGLAAVGGFPLDPKVHMLRQELLEPGTNNRMVIHNANLDH